MLFSSKQGAAIPLSENFITKLMLRAPGDFVKAYVYGLYCVMRRRDVTLPEFCSALGLTEELVVMAFEYWQDCGAVRIKNGSSLSFEYLAVSGGAAAGKLDTHADFNVSLRKLMAPRELNVTELEKIYSYTDTFGLPQEVVLLLVEYCVSHAGKDVSISYMDKVARGWAEEGVNTTELATRKLTAQERKRHPVCEVLEKLGMGARGATQPEIKLYDKWVQWGFDRKAVLRVCDYTVFSRNPSLGSIDRKLTELLQKNAKSVREIEAAFLAEQKERSEKKTAGVKKPQADFKQRDYDREAYDREGVIVIGGDDK